MEKLHHGISEKTLSIFYLFIYLLIYKGEPCWVGRMKGVGKGEGGRGSWALREADFNRPHT